MRNRNYILFPVLWLFLSFTCPAAVAQMPVINCPANISTNITIGTCGAIVTYTTPAGTGTGVTTVQTAGLASGSIFPAGVTTNIFEVTDSSGNKSSCSFTVTVKDNIPPAFTAPLDITIYSNSSCGYNAATSVTGQPDNETDNCPLGLTKATPGDGPRTYAGCAGTSTIIRTWSLTDVGGNTTTHNQTITIADKIKPVLIVPSPVTIECNASILPANTGLATATDNCSDTVKVAYSDLIVPGNCIGRSTITRTWTATDCSGNASSGNQIIQLQDTQPPELTCTSFSVANPDSIPAVDRYKKVSAKDNSGGPVDLFLINEQFIGLTGAPGFCPTSVIRKYEARDNCGNVSATCTQVITVLDISKCSVCQSTVPFFAVILTGAPDSLWRSPSVKRKDYCCQLLGGKDPDKCISFNVYLDKDAVGLIFNIESGAKPEGALFYQVNCGPATPVGDVICLSGGRFYTITFCKPGSNENVYSIKSISGITGATGLVTRQDAKCADTLSVSGIDSTTVVWRVKSPNDQSLLRYLSCTTCMNPVFTPDKFTPPTILYEVCGTLPGTKLCNNNPMTDCNIVTVNTLPAINIAFDIGLGNICAGNIPTINATVSPINAGYTYKWYNGFDGLGSVLDSISSFKPKTKGKYSLEVTETLSGIQCNTAIHNFTIAYDSLGPTILTPPAPLAVVCNDPQALQQISDWLATASAKDGTTTVAVTNDFNGIQPGCNPPPVTFTAIDQCLNVTKSQASFTIIDTQPPAITCPASITGTVDLNECFSKSLVLGTATATDNCAVPLVTNNAPSKFAVGITTVTWTATDACGNKATCNQTVTVSDNNQAPTISCPADVVQTAQPGNCSLNNVIIPNPVTADNCGVVLQTWTIKNPDNSIRNSPTTGINTVSGETFNVGVSVVTYTVQDAVGHTATCSFNVWIKDLVKPVFSSGCPVDVTTVADPGACNAAVTVPVPDIYDPCGESFTVVNTSNASGKYPVGVTTITWTITDASGNITSCIQKITVADLMPILSCPGDITAKADLDKLFATNVNVPAPTFSDSCPGLILIWSMTGATTAVSPATGENIVPTPYTFDVGITTITYTLTDAKDHQVTCTFHVIVESKPEISCPPDILRSTNPSACTASLDPGFPVKISGGDPITYTWKMDGATSTPAFAPGSIGIYTFKKGKTTITWRATNVSGSDECTQEITVEDRQPPTFTLPAPLIECVEKVYSAIFNAALVDINPDRPEYLSFLPGNRSLDLEPLLYSDNCPLSCAVEIRWKIDMKNGTRIPALPALYQTGQPSTFGTTIQFPGDGINFTSVAHTITYWIVDCVGNVSDPQSQLITINPRPNIIK